MHIQRHFRESRLPVLQALMREHPLATVVTHTAGVLAEALAIFQGPNHYVSPAWYAAKNEHGKVVPTWNFVVVHARGSIRWFQDALWLREFLETLTAEHEENLPEPWRISDAPSDYVARMLAAIVGFEIEITAIEGKWKLNQNRSSADRAGVVAALRASGSAAADAIATLVENVGPRPSSEGE